MAHIHRLIFLALVAFSAWLPASSYAYPATLAQPGQPARTQYAARTWDSSAYQAANYRDSKAEACQAGMDHYTARITSVGDLGALPLVLLDVNVCTFKNARGSYSSNWGYGTRQAPAQDPVYSCPNGGSLSGQVCTCISPQVENAEHTACVAGLSEAEKLCKSLKGITTYVTSPGRLMPGATVCAAIGCKAAMSAFVLIVTSKEDGKTTSQGDAELTDQVCTASAPAPGSDDPPQDPAPIATPSNCKGGSVGSVNGVQVCVPYDPNKNVVESVKTSSGSTTTSGTNGAPDTTSSSSTTTSTKCEGGSCETTKTTTKDKGDGTPPAVDKEVEKKPQSDFCKDNPNLPICKTGSFSGTCGASPACDGDAIMCAVAAQTMKTACALNPDPDDSDADYKAAKLKTGSQIGDLPGNEIVNIGASNFDTTDAFGGGSCIGDKTVTVAGRSITLPISGVCPYLVLLGNALVLVSLLLAASIVVRG